MGLFREIPDEKTGIKGEKNSVFGSRQNEKRKDRLFRAKNQHMRLKNAHTTEIRAQESREYKKICKRKVSEISSRLS